MRIPINDVEYGKFIYDRKLEPGSIELLEDDDEFVNGDLQERLRDIRNRSETLFMDIEDGILGYGDYGYGM